MCFGSRQSAPEVAAAPAAPTPPPKEQPIGRPRKNANLDTWGSDTPVLRNTRSTGLQGSSGAGLRM